MTVLIRDFRPQDSEVVNQVAIEAWSEYASVFDNWRKTAQFIGNVASLAADLELIVAELDGKIVGVVGYAPPTPSAKKCFQPNGRSSECFPSRRRRAVSA